MRLRYQARLGLWWRLLEHAKVRDGGFWTGPFATAAGAATLALHENFTPAQRHAWRHR